MPQLKARTARVRFNERCCRAASQSSHMLHAVGDGSHRPDPFKRQLATLLPRTARNRAFQNQTHVTTFARYRETLAVWREYEFHFSID